MISLPRFDIPLLKHHFENGFLLIAGPCVVESLDVCDQVASTMAELSDRLKIPFVFKASYRKANRSSGSSFRGVGDDKALEILGIIRNRYRVPVLTDVHESAEVKEVSTIVDVIQIPAFLSRQTALLEAAADSGKWINIKKAQFLSPEVMQFAVQKVTDRNNRQIMLTERGTQFGYRDLIVDFKGIPVMQRSGYPIILDITHSLQQPNQASGVTNGSPEFIELMARLGLAASVDGLFMEVHPQPSKALSDASTMLSLDACEPMMKRLIKLRETMLNL